MNKKDKVFSYIINNNGNQEIDVFSILKDLWGNRRFISKLIIIFFFLGVIVSFLSNNEYSSSTTFVVQSKKDIMGGNFGGLAEIAGINISNMNGNELSPELYPQIVFSPVFLKDLLNSNFTIKEKEQKITLYDFYRNEYKSSVLSKIKKYTVGLPSLILKKMQLKPTTNREDGKLINISEEEQEIIEILESNIKIEANKKKGYVSIGSTMPEKVLAAEVALKTKELLQEYIINLKTQNSKEQLNFIEKRFLEKEKEFKEIQYRLANYKDRNKVISSSRSETRLVVLQSEYDLAYAIYLELSKKIEAKKIEVKEDTPLFMVLKPVTIPLKKSNTRKLTVIVIWSVFGAFFGVIIVFVRGLMPFLKNKWEKV